MKHWQLLFLFFLSNTTHCFSQTFVNIENKSYADVSLRFYTYETLATHNPKLLKTATVDQNGKLSITIPLQEAQLLYIPIFSFHLIFYAEPNKKTTLKLPEFFKLKQAFSQLKSYSGREVPVFIKEKSSLNQAIANYDAAYNKFLKQNFHGIYKKKNAKIQQEKIKHLQNLHNSAYFQNYTKYKEAYLYYVSGEQAILLSQYFANKPLLLHNTAYVSLLRKLAAPLASDISKAPKYKQLYRKLLATDSYPALLATFESIANTRDTEFNEHFFIYLMQSGVEQKTISRNLTVKKLELIAKNSLNKTNQKLAKSVLVKLQKQFAGSKVPTFTLESINHKNYTEAFLKSAKPTLIAFFDASTNNTESIKTLKELQQKYTNAFQVLVFSAEKELQEIPKNWIQLVIPYNSYLLHDFHLGRFPYYILTNKEGRISKQTWQQYLIGLEKTVDD